nr:proclotting enzyme-like isoform X1 [Cherax quadricarinatus]
MWHSQCLVVALLAASVCQNARASPQDAKRVRRQGNSGVETIVFGGSTQRDPDQCRTPDGDGGRCVRMLDCTAIYDQFRSNPTPEFLTFLRRSICRFEKTTPIICCSNTILSSLISSSTTPASTTTSSTTTASTTTASTTTASTTTTSTTTTTTSTTTTSTTTTEVPLTTAEVPSTTTEAPTTTTVSSTTTPVPETTTTTPPPPTGIRLLPQDVCGISNVNTIRIVGGTPPPKNLYPWLAALGYVDGQGKVEFLCGAALITHQHLVTAAHCVRSRSDLKIVRLGEHDLSISNETVHEDFNIMSQSFHENFDPISYANDIAVIKMDRPATFRKGINAVCLPLPGKFREDSLVGTSGIVAGWGAVSFNNVSSPTLLHVLLPVIGESECALKYTRFRQVKINNTTMCAGVGGRDACQGDSGGPMVMHFHSKTFLVGVVSFGFRCAEPNFPGVYTRVKAYLDWILSNLN